MLHLHFAPSLDLILPRLHKYLRDVWTDPFDAPDVIVPSPALGKWLRMRLADGGAGESPVDNPFGCVANLPLPTLERSLWEMLAPDPDMVQLGLGLMQQIVCALLTDDCIVKPGFGPVKAYLSTLSGIDSLKRIQLAARVAHQFLEYEYNRPSVWNNGMWVSHGIDASWLQRRSYFHPELEDERWQSELYRNVNEYLENGVANPGGGVRHYLSLPRLYRLRREHGLAGGHPWLVGARTLFLVGATKVSHFHRNMLVEISQMKGVELHVFLTNPCAEFWEDVDTRRSRALRRSWRFDSDRDKAGIAPRTPGDYNKAELNQIAALPADHPLLELWGSAGKENIFLWCQQAQWNFDYVSPPSAESDTPPATLLGAVQRSLLRRESLPLRPDTVAPSEASLQILACPDRGREIEEIREQILDMVLAGVIDNLNEVVVYLPDPCAYEAYIQRVFGRFAPWEPDYIPTCLLGTPGKESVYAQGITCLLELARNHFDRAHVFELLRNPIVQSTRRLSADMVAVWEQWAEALGIFRGYNRKHRALMGDTGAALTGEHTFELGMMRMLIAELAAGPVELDESKTFVIPYRDFETSDRDTLETFCRTVDALHDDLARLRDALEKSLAAALEVMDDCAAAWMGRITENVLAESAAEANVQRSFLAALPLILLQDTVAGRHDVPPDEFFALVGGCLPNELPAHAQAWTGGVTFAPLRPSMIVPHTVIFAAGLDSGAFPGTSDRPAWELLSNKRIVGDTDKVRDNRFAFLELIHAARARLVLSFRSLDMQKEEELQPSSVILELEAHLRAQGLVVRDTNGAEQCSVRREIPWLVHESLQSLVRAGRKHATWDNTATALAAIARMPRVRHRHDLEAAPVSAVKNAPALRTSLYDLRKFFANPLEYHLVRTLGIELDDEPGTLSAVDEPLDSGMLALSELQKQIWIEMLGMAFPAEAEHEIIRADRLREIASEWAERLYAAHRGTGWAPEAQMADVERCWLVAWARNCVGPVLELRSAYTNHCFVENCDLSLRREGFDSELSITLANGEPCSITCHHGAALLARRCSGQDSHEAAFIGFKREGKVKENSDLFLSAALQVIYGADSGVRPRLSLIQINRGDGNGKKCGCESVVLSSVYGSEAGDGKVRELAVWLSGIVDEMLVQRCSDHLPFAVVQKLWKNGWGSIDVERIQEELENPRGAYHCYVPAFDLTGARIPAVDNAALRARIEARFAPMLEGWLYA